MIDLEGLIKPTWFAEEWLLNAWSLLKIDEQLMIKERVDEVFYNELPFQLKHDRIVYIHLFSLLAQLEILGLQGFLKTLQKLTGTDLYSTMRKQILDEIFHAIVFVKITYQLSTPYSFPPSYDKTVEQVLTLLSNEPDLNTSLVLINLIAESWVEEIFLCMKNHNIASDFIDTIIADENRHIEDSDLYLKDSHLDKHYLARKLTGLEEELIKLMFSQEKYILSFINLFGREGTLNLVKNIDIKHQITLKKIDLSPSKHWQFFMGNIASMVENVFYDQSKDNEIALSTTRKVLSSLWKNPDQPTQSGQFSLNITPVAFFEKKYKPEILTGLFLQTLSKCITNNPILKNYLSNNKIYSPRDSYIGLAVRLPDCGDQISMIEFKNCHEFSIADLAQFISDDIKLMAYCYKKSEALKIEHPYLADLFNDLLTPSNQNIYQDPLFTKPTISLSNIGQWGYEMVSSPLFPHETLKFTLAKIERKQVWNNRDKQFEIQDQLPVGLSADHRVLDGNIPIAAFFQTAFDQMFTKMTESLREEQSALSSPLNEFIAGTDKLLQNDLEFGFRYLFYASQIWKHGKTQAIFKPNFNCSDSNRELTTVHLG